MADGRWRIRHLSGRRCVLVGAALILSACGGLSAVTSTTATVAVDTTSLPSTTTTTTTPVATSVDICGRGTIWEAGVTHVAPCFLQPLVMVPPEEGWRTSRATLEVIEGVWVPPGEGEPALRYVVLAYQPDELPQESIDSILAIDGIHAFRPATHSPDRSQVDVETNPLEPAEVQCVFRVANALRWHGGEGDPGYVLLDEGTVTLPATYGLGACRVFRIWALGVSDITVTVIATVDDLDRFDELMPRMQRLVDTITVAAP